MTLKGLTDHYNVSSSDAISIDKVIMETTANNSGLIDITGILENFVLQNE